MRRSARTLAKGMIAWDSLHQGLDRQDFHMPTSQREHFASRILEWSMVLFSIHAKHFNREVPVHEARVKDLAATCNHMPAFKMPLYQQTAVNFDIDP